MEDDSQIEEYPTSECKLMSKGTFIVIFLCQIAESIFVFHLSALRLAYTKLILRNP